MNFVFQTLSLIVSDVSTRTSQNKAQMTSRGIDSYSVKSAINHHSTQSCKLRNGHQLVKFSKNISSISHQSETLKDKHSNSCLVKVVEMREQ